MHPVKKVDVGGQAGEGLTVFAESEEGPNAVFTPSNRIVVSTLFSTGVGPIYENDTDGMPGFPYRGKAGITELDALTKSEYRQAVREVRKKEFIKAFPSRWRPRRTTCVKRAAPAWKRCSFRFSNPLQSLCDLPCTPKGPSAAKWRVQHNPSNIARTEHNALSGTGACLLKLAVALMLLGPRLAR